MALNQDYHSTFVTLVEDVQTSLKSSGVDLTDEFVVMLVKLVSLDPPNKFLIRQQMVKTELDRMRKIVVDRILAMSPLSRDIISMQLYFRMNYYHRDDSVEAHRLDADEKIKSLLDDIKSGIPKNLKHYDIWYAKLIGATIIEADMGSATSSSVIRETEAALTSVFPKEDINLLSTMSVKDREIELFHLMHVCIGIRLYSKNKNPSEYGELIEDWPKLIPEKIEKTIALMGSARDENIQRLIRYTTIAQPYFLRQLVFRMGRRAVNSDMIKIRQALVMVHQALIYLKDLTSDLTHEQGVCTELVQVHHNILHDLHQTYKKDADVPRTVLYPKFVELSNSWRDLLECNVFVDSIAHVLEAILASVEKNLVKMDEIVGNILENSKIPSEKEFFTFRQVNLPEDKYALAKRVDFREDLSPLQMSFTGFCIHSFVKGIGLLVMSNTELGIFNWKNSNYLLSNVKAAIEFRRDPDSFVRRGYAIARKNPELIALLNIEREAFDPTTISDADRSLKTTNILVSSDAESQTELHPVKDNIVKNYTWNEWELRRRGLILSNIHKCRTHGTQTHWQALKYNASCQTFASKSACVQTNRDVYSEIPLSQYYMYGLRGLHCGVPPHTVEIITENPTDLKCMVSTKQVPQLDIKIGLPFMSQVYNQD